VCVCVCVHFIFTVRCYAECRDAAVGRPSVSLSICLSRSGVFFHTGWNTSKRISRPSNLNQHRRSGPTRTPPKYGRIRVGYLCVISAFERSLMKAYTRKPCCGIETARRHDSIEIYSAVLPATARFLSSLSLQHASIVASLSVCT